MNDRPIRGDPNFTEQLMKIKAMRLLNNKDTRPVPIARIQKGITRHPLWEKIKKDLEIADFVEDKKAQASVFNIFTFMIIAFVAVVLFAGFIWVTGLLNSTFVQIGINNEGNAGMEGYVNLTHAANVTFGQMNDSIQALRLVALCIIIAEILSFILMAAFVRRHPALFVVYMFIIVLAVIFAAPISNSYYELMHSGIYDGLLESFQGSNFFLLNLPLVVAVVGVFGGIFMFINLMRSGNEVGIG